MKKITLVYWDEDRSKSVAVSQLLPDIEAASYLDSIQGGTWNGDRLIKIPSKEGSTVFIRSNALLSVVFENGIAETVALKIEEFVAEAKGASKPPSTAILRAMDSLGLSKDHARDLIMAKW
jgi:hypothetical protein